MPVQKFRTPGFAGSNLFDHDAPVELRRRGSRTRFSTFQHKSKQPSKQDSPEIPQRAIQQAAPVAGSERKTAGARSATRWRIDGYRRNETVRPPVDRRSPNASR